MTSTSALLLLADRFRERSQQRTLGISEVGGCRRKTGYKLAGTTPVNSVGSVQAVMGTAIHGAVAEAVKLLGRPGDLFELEVEYAGIVGHLDRYEAATKTVVDVKTVSTRWCEHIKLHGPSRQQKWQVSLYSAALMTHDPPVPVENCRLDFLVRDSGEEYQVKWKFDPKDVQEAIEWLREVKNTPIPLLPRDEEPDSVICRGCPFGGVDGGICWKGYVPDRDFRSVFLAEGKNSGEAAAELFDVRAKIRDLKKKEERLKGILDGERPERLWKTIKAGDHYLKWVPTRGRPALKFVSPPNETKEHEEE